MSTNRQWRKFLKKHQRKKRRQKAAKVRDKILAEGEAVKLNDPSYQDWLKKEQEIAEFQRLCDERIRNEEEASWLRRELIVQEVFRLDKQRRQTEATAQAALRLEEERILAARKEACQKKLEEKTRHAVNVAAEFERTIQCLQDYLDDTNMSTPPHMHTWAETNPGQKVCAFFDRTNCCRYGIMCLFNHRRPLLSNSIVVRNFFTHSLLEQASHKEYDGADSLLEFSDKELRDDYDTFFDDVLPELKQFGTIRNFLTVSNVMSHLRGHVFIEYTNKRSSLKAFIKLQGRFYATKRLNVEFSNITNWRSALCGLALTRKCPKGLHCNYLHVFRNPRNKYNSMLEYSNPLQTVGLNTHVKVSNTPSLSWNDVDKCKDVRGDKHNWRWSESPDVELKSNEKNVSDLPRKDHRSDKNRSKSVDKRSCSNKRKISDCRSKSRVRSSTDYNRSNTRKDNSTDSKKSSNKIESSICKKKESHKRNKKRSNSHKEECIETCTRNHKSISIENLERSDLKKKDCSRSSKQR